MPLLDLGRRRRARQLAAWQAVDAELHGFLDDCTRDDWPDDQPAQVALRPSEQALLVFDGASLTEPRHAPGHYQGGYASITLPRVGPVRPRIGGTRGHYTPGPEQQQVVDRGELVVTSTRVVFAGGMHTLTWPLEKITELAPMPGVPQAVLIGAEGREKVDGLVADSGAHADLLRFRIQLAQARRQGPAAVAALRVRLEREVADHQARRPTG